MLSLTYAAARGRFYSMIDPRLNNLATHTEQRLQDIEQQLKVQYELNKTTNAVMTALAARVDMLNEQLLAVVRKLNNDWEPL